MKTTVYLVRHSEPLRKNIGYETTKDVFMINYKIPLSIDGEKLAESLSEKEEFKNIDILWSSSYSRTLDTAKYFALKNNILINVDDDLGERKQGIKSWDELPSDFEQHQFEDENYKIGDGESRLESTKRIEKVFNKILNENLGKRILIVGHCTVFTYLMQKWCDIEYNGEYKFKGNVFFSGKWKYCNAFKLVFEENDLINIEEVI